MGNKTQRSDARIAGPQLTHDYLYDTVYRLIHTTVTNPARAIVRDTDYGLDGVGNRTSVAGSPDPGSYAMDSACPDPTCATPNGCEPADHQMNQYTTTPFDSRANDRNGNLVSYGGCLSGDVNNDHVLNNDDVPSFVALLLADPPNCSADLNQDGVINSRDLHPFVSLLLGQTIPTRQFELRYDYANQMVEHRDTISSRRHTYAYDALGRRIKKVVDTDGAAGGPVETRFYLDGWREIEEQDTAASTVATYVYGNYIDEVLNMRRSGTDYYYHTDDLYNVMAITNASGAVAERYEYLDYGQLAEPSTDSPVLNFQSQISNPSLFSGRRWDAETALYYYRMRYLHPLAGRFITRDPIGYGAGRMGLFQYVSGNPYSLLDPLGLDEISPALDLATDFIPVVSTCKDAAEHLDYVLNSPYPEIKAAAGIALVGDLANLVLDYVGIGVILEEGKAAAKAARAANRAADAVRRAKLTKKSAGRAADAVRWAKATAAKAKKAATKFRRAVKKYVIEEVIEGVKDKVRESLAEKVADASAASEPLEPGGCDCKPPPSPPAPSPKPDAIKRDAEALRRAGHLRQADWLEQTGGSGLPE